MVVEWLRIHGPRWEAAAALVLWAAVVLRVPSLRLPRQRALWLAVTTAAAAMSLSLAIHHFVRPKGEGLHALSLLTNLFGVFSAGAVLAFVVTATGSGRYRHRLYVSTAAVITALVVLDLLTPRHTGHTVHPHGPAVPSLGFWVLLTAAHLASDVTCVWMCGHYGRRSDNRLARATLLLLGLGTAFAGLYWVGRGIQLTLPVTWIGPVLPFCMFWHALFRAAALLIPVAAAASATARRMVALWRLWPLWDDVTALVPHVVLVRRRSRLGQLLRPQGSLSLLQYRTQIEIRDALLVLQAYIEPATPEQARRYLRTVAKQPPVSRQAAVMACLVRYARRSALKGAPPPAHPRPVPAEGFATGDLDEESSFLAQVAIAYTSPAVRSCDEWWDRECAAAAQRCGLRH